MGYTTAATCISCIHADRHGAVVVPMDKISATRGARRAAPVDKTEARIIEAARAPGATVERIKAAIRG